MKKEVWAIFLVVFVGLLGYSIILPILPLYAETFGATPFVAGLLFTSYAICQFIGGPILGALSDKHGRKPWLIFSQVGTVIGFIMMGAAPTLAILFAARIIDGLSGGNVVIAQAYISDITQPQDRAKTFGLIGVAFGLGFIVGPMLGGILAHYGGYPLPAYVAAGISFVSIILTALILPETAQEKHRVEGNILELLKHMRAFLKTPTLRTMLLEFFIFTMIFYTYTTTLTLYLERTLSANAQQLGLLYGYVGILVMLGQGVIIRILLKKFPEREVARQGFAFCLASFLVMIVFPSSWGWMILAASLFSLGVSQLRPTLTSIITQHVRRDEQGRTLGVTQSADSISAILGPTIGGFLITYTPLINFGILEAIGALIGVVLLRKKHTTSS